MNRLRLTLILILIPFHFVFSQSKSNDKATVYGELSHERYKAPIVDANVLLVQVNGNKVDSTYRVSTRNGIFIYKNLKPGKVYIKVSKMGMESVDGVFDLTEGDNAVLFTMRNSQGSDQRGDSDGFRILDADSWRYDGFQCRGGQDDGRRQGYRHP